MKYLLALTIVFALAAVAALPSGAQAGPFVYRGGAWDQWAQNGNTYQSNWGNNSNMGYGYRGNNWGQWQNNGGYYQNNGGYLLPGRQYNYNYNQNNGGYGYWRGNN